MVLLQQINVHKRLHRKGFLRRTIYISISAQFAQICHFASNFLHSAVTTKIIIKCPCYLWFFFKLVDLIESTIGAKFHQSLEIKFGGAVGKVSWRLDLEIKCLRRSNRKLAAARFNCFQMSIHLKTSPSWATQPNQLEDKDNLNCFCRSNCKLGNSTAVKYQFTCRLDLTNAL